MALESSLHLTILKEVCTSNIYILSLRYQLYKNIHDPEGFSFSTVQLQKSLFKNENSLSVKVKLHQSVQNETKTNKKIMNE